MPALHAAGAQTVEREALLEMESFDLEARQEQWVSLVVDLAKSFVKVQ